ncbi:phage major capsid protein [Sphingobium chlorophenolicum]|uniref:Phage major capsid protein, HK97 family n=1 Tax=Sphingobium chlorophenolicum TaxID=46429 RepID=A0A081RAC8_SPHCR|nr:phage major capsid protein [Sphingobium chlorophenolicum]KEQ52151.1 Phage major capsid protein, HK97 family precursor [Sphingobium chlorophenolicum]
MTTSAPADRAEVIGSAQHRHLTIRLAANGKGVLQATLSSELPYNRDGMDEILVHTQDAVNLERAAMGLPLLIDHDLGRQLGRVENIRLQGRKLVGDIRLSDRDEVAGIVADIRSGIRPDISISYEVHAIKVADDAESYQVTRWTPFEVSSVSCPADFSVGIGRSFSKSSRKVLTMNAITTPDLSTSQIQAERERAANITAMGRRLNVEELAQRAVNEGWSIEKFVSSYEQAAPAARSLRTAEAPAIDSHLQREINQYSLVRAVACQINNRFDGREAEVNAELSRHYGATPRGFFAPLAALQSRAQQVGTPNIGGNLVGTDHLADEFYMPFRNSAAVMGLGATVITDLHGNVEIPRQESSMTGQWISEDQAPDETTLNFGKLGMTPKTVAGYMSWSRQAALQALPSMENILRNELSEQLGLGLDLAAVKGVGSAVEPRGILNTSGIGSVQGGTNGSAPTWDHIVDLESAVANQNATGDNMGYLTNTKVRGKLKKTQTFSGTNGDPVWGRDGRLNGYSAAVSNQVPANLTKGTAAGTCSAIIFGNWRDLIIGLWSYVDIIVDPFTYSTQGKVRISGFLSADIAVKRPTSFAVMADALTS